MSKNNVIKRALALGFCLLLAIAALLFPLERGGVRAGAGNGKNRKIESAEELSVLLGHITDQMENSAEPLSLLADDPSGLPSETPQYTSVTLEDTLRFSMKASSGLSSSSSRIDRQMTAYLTEEATYYVSEATISSSRRVSEKIDGNKVVQKEVNEKTDIDLRIHIWISKEASMLRFDRYTVLENGVKHALPSNVIGKWVVFTLDDDTGIFDRLTSVDGHNFAVLALMGEMLAIEDNFTRSRDTYKMTDSAFRSFLTGVERIDGVSGSSSGEDAMKGSFVASLKNSRRPRVTIDLKDSYLSGSKMSDDYFSMNFGQTEELTFLNIDNTVVGKPSEKNALTSDELAAILKNWEG